MKRTGILFILSIFFFFHKIQAQSEIIVALSSGDIYSVNVNTCTSTYLNNFNSFLDIAICPNGKLYGISGDIYELDVSSGDATYLSYAAYSTCLVCDENNILYYMDGSFLYSYNPTTLTSNFIGDVGYSSAGDLTFFQDTLYLAEDDDHLIQINIESGAITSIVNIGSMGQPIFGISTISELDSTCSPKQTMLASYGYDLYTVNPNNGDLSLLCGNVVSDDIWGGASLSEASSLSGDPAGKDTSLTICSGNDTLFLSHYLNGSFPNMGNWINATPNGIHGDSLFTQVFLTGTHNLTYVIDTNQCRDTALLKLTIKSSFLPDLNWDDTSMCVGDTLTLNAFSGPANYIWQDLSHGYQYTVTQNGTYHVTINNGCTSKQESISVSFENCACEYIITNVFSPNQDHVNDIFTIDINPFCKFKLLTIYNRWGNLIYEGHSNTWSGLTKDGRLANEGVYYYIASINQKRITGYVTLLR